MNASQSFMSAIILREPAVGEGKALHALIQSSPPLDLNSVYCYFLLVRHFRETCVVAESGGAPAGCVTAYLRPDDSRTLFVWQVAVAGAFRNLGIAGRMLEDLLARPVCRDVLFLETTVGAGNAASRRCFERLALSRGVAVREQAFLEPEHFGPDAKHEAEILLRIGPLSKPTNASVNCKGIQNGNL